MIISDKIYNRGVGINVYQYNYIIKRVFGGKCIKFDITLNTFDLIYIYIYI